MTDTNKLKAQIHIAKSQLGMDDDTYREVLKSATGKTSSAQMGVVELHKALQAFKDRGFKSRPPKQKTAQKKPAGPYGLLQRIKDQWRAMRCSNPNSRAMDAAASIRSASISGASCGLRCALLIHPPTCVRAAHAAATASAIQ